ncbi:MAG: ferrochelatase [Burkholderiales bacterium]
MSRYRAEPSHTHGQPAKTGILLVNLGTPNAPTRFEVKRYLRQFLSDPRVVEIPRALWWIILNFFILPTRPDESAKKYAAIWDNREGSPLLFHTEKQAKLLQGWLGERIRSPYAVDFAMRYGRPSVDSALKRLSDQACDRILCIPLYPQYAASSTASAFDAIFRNLLTRRNQPALRTVKHYHDDAGYIAALANNVQSYWQQNGRPDRLIMSFHGVPRYTLEKGDPYFCECQKTGRLLAEALALTDEQYLITFQSRFGRAEWVKPYTAATLTELGRARTRRVDVICPGFTADCLETLEEIAMEVKTDFLKAGGGEFHYIPALNEGSLWIEALGNIALTNLQGWINTGQAIDTTSQSSDESRQRAMRLGAKQ